MRAEAYSAKGDRARALADYENAITDIESDRSGYETQLARNTATLAVSSDLVAAIAGRDKARAAYSE